MAERLYQLTRVAAGDYLLWEHWNTWETGFRTRSAAIDGALRDPTRDLDPRESTFPRQGGRS